MFKLITEVGAALAMLSSLVNRLRARPDAAAADLADALGEVEKTYVAVETEIARLAALALPGALERDPSALASLESGLLVARVDASRGHCSRIANIHDLHLKRWFNTVFVKDLKPLRIDAVFDTLRNEDSVLHDLLDPLIKTLSGAARAAMDILTSPSPDFAAARKRLAEARQQLQPLRDELAPQISKLRALQTEFIEISKVV